MRYKKLVTLVEPHASAVSLLKNGQQCYIKAINNNKNIYPLLHIAHLCFFFQWKEILEKTLADLDKEISDLSEAKELTEDALEAKNIPTDTVVENLTIRESRHGIDIVQDEVENQLHKVCVHLYASVVVVVVVVWW